MSKGKPEAKELFRQEYIRCGKLGCTKCPHGPYWYGYRREAGKLHKRYIGKLDPRLKDLNVPKKEAGHRWDDIFQRSKASERLALEILGCPFSSKLAEVQKEYRRLVLELHPDRGGTVVEMQRVIAAWTYLKSLGKNLFG